MMNFKIILLLILLSNCTNKQFESKIERYDKFRKDVSSVVFDELPLNRKEIKNSFSQTIVYPYSLDVSKYCGVFLTYNYDENTFIEKSNYLNEVALFKSNVQDTCNLKISTSQLFSNENCNEQLIPVPSIDDKFNNLKKMVNTNSDYLILSGRKGEFINKEVLGKVDFENNPITMNHGKNGYSTGVVINYESRTIIYWVLIY